MTVVLGGLRWIRRSIVTPVFVASRRFKLRCIAWTYGGDVVIGQEVSIQHSVVFQGRGTLVIRDRVMLGFGLAGARRLPILLQPREPGSTIVLGEGCAVMNGCELMARTSITIGRDTLVGPHTWIVDADFHGIEPHLRGTAGLTAPVEIDDQVWIGAKVIILKGVHIGRGAIVAAGCVVSKNVPAGTIVAGNPMRTIGTVERSGKDRPRG